MNFLKNVMLINSIMIDEEKLKSPRNPNNFNFLFKFMWGLSAFGQTAIAGTYATFLQTFYHVYMGLDNDWIGLAAWIYAIWNAVNDPIFGFMTDSSKSERGRRVPFLRYTAPFLGLTFIMVWMVPKDLTGMPVFWWMLITMLLYDTCFTIVGLAYSALLPELSESDLIRGELQQYTTILGIVGQLVGFLIPDLLRPKGASTSFLPLYIGMIAVGVIGALTIFIASFMVKERKEFSQVDDPVPFFDAIKYSFKSKAFITVVSANFLSILVVSLLTGNIYYMADYVFQIDATLLLAPIFLGLIIGALFTNFLVKKLGPAHTYQVLCVIGGIALLFTIIANQILIYPLLFIAGCGIAGPQVLFNVLMAQVSDEDELKVGVRREGMFFGINALITKPAQSIALWLAPLLIDSAGFIPAQNNIPVLNQPEEVLTVIRILIGLIPGIALIVEAFILILYPLKDDYLIEVQNKVKRLHEEKHSKLISQQSAGEV